jgi:hypothetical protein
MDTCHITHSLYCPLFTFSAHITIPNGFLVAHLHALLHSCYKMIDSQEGFIKITEKPSNTGTENFHSVLIIALLTENALFKWRSVLHLTKLDGSG